MRSTEAWDAGLLNSPPNNSRSLRLSTLSFSDTQRWEKGRKYADLMYTQTKSVTLTTNQVHSPKKTWILEMVMTGSNTFTNTKSTNLQGKKIRFMKLETTYFLLPWYFMNSSTPQFLAVSYHRTVLGFKWDITHKYISRIKHIGFAHLVRSMKDVYLLIQQSYI